MTKPAKKSTKNTKRIKSKKKGPIVKKKTAKVSSSKKSPIIKKARKKSDASELKDLKVLSDEANKAKDKGKDGKKPRKRKKKMSPFTRITTEVRSTGHSNHSVYNSEVVENKPENVREKIVTNWDAVHSGKVLGYCPGCLGRGGRKQPCENAITTLDLEEGKLKTFVCTECNYRGRTSKLIKEVPEKREENFDPWK